MCNAGPPPYYAVFLISAQSTKSKCQAARRGEMPQLLMVLVRIDFGSMPSGSCRPCTSVLVPLSETSKNVHQKPNHLPPWTMPDDAVSEFPSGDRPPRPALRIQIPPHTFRRSSSIWLSSDHASDSSRSSGTCSPLEPRPESDLQPPANPPLRSPLSPRAVRFARRDTAEETRQFLQAPPGFPHNAFVGRLLPERPDPTNMHISVFAARRKDAHELLRVQMHSRLNFRTHVDFETWSRWTSRRGTVTEHMFLHQVLEEDEKVWVAAAKLATGEHWMVGFAACSPTDLWAVWDTREECEEVVHVQIHVDVSFRRMGVGSRLLKQVEDVMWRRGFGYLVTSAFNDQPWKESEQAFLKKNGFQRLNTHGWHFGEPPLPYI
ncbi:hypothetical protein B0T20DRAFT_397662 [Sordaria brevicollis]|uniref:N-acetyltransferase domain-containing protein n=1 Tax=Sordaria brevicollis TaxID=83679 RepID=A0AAE0U2N3_SORBR|nr:hypothetical protein B0T20DRAFT_397662 [Sordaria brevicollis]